MFLEIEQPPRRLVAAAARRDHHKVVAILQVDERRGSFGVSILADDQSDLCRRLAGKAPDKFDDVPWSPAPVTGSPLVAGAVAHLDCDLEQQHLAGDHWIVVGRVRALDLHRGEADPLVFCRGAFGRHQSF